MLNKVAEEAKSVDDFVFSVVVEVLQDVREIWLGALLDSLLSGSLEDLDELAGKFHDLRHDGAHFGHVLLNFIDILVIEVVVLLGLADNHLGGSLEGGHEVASSLDEWTEGFDLGLSEEVSSGNVVLVKGTEVVSQGL